MMMQPIRTITGTPLVLPDENIDTDRIIPARFLTTTSREGLGQHAFADWRMEPGCPLVEGPVHAKIIVAGHNFGCGSSREHAAWALADMGVQAVISSGLADIFRANASRNGIVPVVVSADALEQLTEAAGRTGWEITVDLENRSVVSPSGTSFPFEIDAFARTCLLEGVDHLGYLLQHLGEIREYEAMEVASWAH